MAGIPQSGSDPNQSGIFSVPRAASIEIIQIESARRALRVLDAEIARTEVRLRSMPALVAQQGLPGSATSRLNMRSPHAGRLMSAHAGGNSAHLGPIHIGKHGLGLNPRFLRFGGAALGLHIVAGTGNQLIHMRDENKQRAAEGATMDEQIRATAMGTVGKVAALAGNIVGVVPLAKTLFKAAGNTEEDTEAMFQRAYDKVFARDDMRRKDLARAKRVEEATAAVRKQYADNNEFLDNWTPEDFDVQDDFGRSALRSEIRAKNRNLVNAIEERDREAAIQSASKDAQSGAGD